MRYSTSYYSTKVTISATPTEYIIGTDIRTKEISGIQNNTTEIVKVKFNDGDGVLQIPVDGYFEPFTPIIGSIIIYGSGTGDCCVLG